MTLNVAQPTYRGIEQAADRLRSVMAKTPLIFSEPLSHACGAQVWLKLESMTPIGSFKLRGAANAMLVSDSFAESKLAYTASTGNHGQGVAYAARLIGGQAHVFLPEHPNPEKKRNIEALGATAVEIGADFDEAKDAALEACIKQGGFFVDDGASIDVLQGAGTVGHEVAQSLESIDAVVIPVGGGCLAAGTALAVKMCHPKAQTIGVQSAQAPAMYLSFQAGEPIEAPNTTHAEGLALRIPPRLNLDQIIRHLDDMRLVEDDMLTRAAKTMIVRGRQLAEPGSCAPLAALWQARDDFVGKTVVLVVSGANLDGTTLERVTAAPLLF